MRIDYGHMCLKVVLITALLGCALAPGSATEPEPKPPVRTDVYGDALPAGALARLGTIRWRHGGPVTFVSFLADGTALLTASQDNTVRVWDLATGKEVRRLDLHQAATGGTAQFRMMGAGGGGMVVMGGLGGGFSGMLGIALAPDKSLLATYGLDQKIHLWEPATGKELRQIQAPQGGVGGLAFSPDGKNIAAKGLDGIIQVLEIATGKSLRQIGNQDRQSGMMAAFGGGKSLVFSPDGKKLVSAGMEFENQKLGSVVKFYDADTGKELRQLKETAGTIEILSPVFSPDSKLVAWSSMQGGIQLVDPETGKKVRQLASQALAHVAFAPDGKTLVSQSPFDQVLRVWEVATGKELRTLGKPFTSSLPFALNFGGSSSESLAFSPDGKQLAVLGQGNTIRVLDAATGKDALPATGHQAAITAIRFAADGKTLTTRGADGAFRVWEPSGKQVRQIPVTEAAMTYAISADGRTLAASEPTGLRIREVANGKELHRIEAQKTGFAAIAFSPDGKLLAARNMLGPTIHLFDLATGKEIRQLGAAVKVPDGKQPIMIMPALTSSGGLTFSPDGKTLASGLQHNTLALWDVPTGQERLPIRLPDNNVIRDVEFAPDGRSLAITEADHSISLWEVATGAKRRAYAQPPAKPALPQMGMLPQLRAPGVVMGAIDFSGFVSDTPKLAFSPDGNILAQGRQDRCIGLWDVAGGEELGRLPGHGGEITSLSFAPDGRTLASASADTTALIWDVADWSKRLRVRAGELKMPELEARWDELAQIDAGKAFDAVLALAAARAQAVPFLAKQLRPTEAADAKMIDQLINDLDSSQFKMRKKASTDLEKLGELAVPALRRVLAGQPSPETRQRAEELLKKLDGPNGLAGERLRTIRAIEVLEKIGTPEARQLLQTLATGAEGALTTRTALDALKRLAG